MAHPLVRLVATRPQMLAEHVCVYADLLVEKTTAAAGQLKRQLVLPWRLIVAPVTPAAAGIAAWIVGGRSIPND